MGSVHELAVNYVTKGYTDSTYLYQFPNNVAIAIIYCILFKIASIVKVTDFLSVATVFNALIVSGSIILLYFITKKIFDKKKALMMLIISLITTPFYLYSAIYYTDTLSMFMMLLIAYLFIVIKDYKPKKKLKKIISWVALGIITVVAIKIKITTSFIIIAYLLYDVFTGKIIKEWKNFIPIIATMAIMMIVWGVMQNNFIIKNKEVVNIEKLPIEHWIVMGLDGNGGYNEEDWEYIRTFETYDEKKKASIEKIKERLSNYNATTFLKHINEKLKYAWTDGTYLAPEKLRRSPANYNIMHEFILSSGKYVKFYKYFPQIMHMSMLILIFVGICNTVKKDNLKNVNMIFYILMFGFIMFLLIWENRSRYIFTVVPFLMMLQLEGIDISSKKIKGK